MPITLEHKTEISFLSYAPAIIVRARKFRKTKPRIIGAISECLISLTQRVRITFEISIGSGLTRSPKLDEGIWVYTLNGKVRNNKSIFGGSFCVRILFCSLVSSSRNEPATLGFIGLAKSFLSRF